MKTIAFSVRSGLVAIVIGLSPAPRTALAQFIPRAAPEPAPPAPVRSESDDQAESGAEARAALDAIMLYDQDNPDLPAMQRADVATKDMPRDPMGFVDWMRALRENRISPRTSLDGKGSMKILDKDVILKNTKEMPWVRFPHLSHTMWLDCTNCHPSPFADKAGATRITMADIFRGKFCGMCHDRVAFVTFFSCMRCHSVPQTPLPPQK